MRSSFPKAIESVEQFASMWNVFLSERHDADLRDLTGLTVRWAESRFAFWNLLFLTETLENRDDLLFSFERAAAIMQAKRQVGFFCICEQLLSPEVALELNEVAGRFRMARSVTCYGMEAEQIELAVPTVSSLEFRRVRTSEELRAYAEINSAAYQLPIGTVPEALGDSRFWKREVQMYLGMLEGNAVSAAATVANKDAVFLALVATLPEFQSRGFGEAVVRKALSECRKETGLTRSVLHATAAGFPLYAKLGYKKTADIYCYTIVE